VYRGASTVSGSVVDPHHVDVGPDADPDSTYHPDADPDTDSDSDFYFMRIRIRPLTRMRIRNTGFLCFMFR
jgi:hypothetical protein